MEEHMTQFDRVKEITDKLESDIADLFESVAYAQAISWREAARQIGELLE